MDSSLSVKQKYYNFVKEQVKKKDQLYKNIYLGTLLNIPGLKKDNEMVGEFNIPTNIEKSTKLEEQVKEEDDYDIMIKEYIKNTFPSEPTFSIPSQKMMFEKIKLIDDTLFDFFDSEQIYALLVSDDKSYIDELVKQAKLIGNQMNINKEYRDTKMDIYNLQNYVQKMDFGKISDEQKNEFVSNFLDIVDPYVDEHNIINYKDYKVDDNGDFYFVDKSIDKKTLIEKLKTGRDSSQQMKLLNYIAYENNKKAGLPYEPEFENWSGAMKIMKQFHEKKMEEEIPSENIHIVGRDDETVDEIIKRTIKENYPEIETRDKKTTQKQAENYIDTINTFIYDRFTKEQLLGIINHDIRFGTNMLKDLFYLAARYKEHSTDISENKEYIQSKRKIGSLLSDFNMIDDYKTDIKFRDNVFNDFIDMNRENIKDGRLYYDTVDIDNMGDAILNHKSVSIKVLKNDIDRAIAPKKVFDILEYNRRTNDIKHNIDEYEDLDQDEAIKQVKKWNKIKKIIKTFK